MNALCLAAALLGISAVNADADATKAYEARVHKYTGGEYKDEEFKYRMLSPANIEAGKKYPVVLFLHGAGERGDDNESQLKYFPTWMAEAKMREKYPCFVIAPQCRTGKSWSVGNWGAKDSSEMPKQPTDQLKVAIAVLDSAMKSLPIDEKRVYLTGLSMGGYGSWELAMRQPNRFAAVAPICGGGDESQAEKLVKVPLWAWHGNADPAVPVDRSRNMIAAIKKAGGEPKYTELEGVGHDSWTAAYTRQDGVVPWLFEQAKK
ncbi:MAG: alpha/beta hydrolase-fold protein [Pirellulales bacterium]